MKILERLFDVAEKAGINRLMITRELYGKKTPILYQVKNPTAKTVDNVSQAIFRLLDKQQQQQQMVRAELRAIMDVLDKKYKIKL